MIDKLTHSKLLQELLSIFSHYNLNRANLKIKLIDYELIHGEDSIKAMLEFITENIKAGEKIDWIRGQVAHDLNDYKDKFMQPRTLDWYESIQTSEENN